MRAFGVDWNPFGILLGAIIFIGAGVTRGGWWIAVGVGIFLFSLLVVWFAVRQGVWKC